LAALTGRALTIFRAGLALNAVGSFVNGLMPFRSLVAGFLMTTNFAKPGIGAAGLLALPNPPETRRIVAGCRPPRIAMIGPTSDPLLQWLALQVGSVEQQQAVVMAPSKGHEKLM
jgi:hypothetical protein